MSDIIGRVELHQAFMWDCPDCGRENFVRAVRIAPESLAADGMPPGIDREDFEGVPEYLASGGEGYWLQAPDRVMCGYCGVEYETEEF